MRILSLLLIISVLLWPSAIVTAAQEQLRRPIALDKIDQGDLYALDATGTIISFAILDNALAIKSSFALPVSASPTDLVSAKLFSQPTLLISSNNQRSGFVSQYSLQGRLQHYWNFRNSVAGIDVDYNAHIIYVASSDSPEVFQINLQQSHEANPSFLASVFGAVQLGPVVFDLTKHRLLIGDIGAGKIFELDLQTRKSRVLTRDLGSPQALLISSTLGLLYIADASRRKIYVLDLKGDNATPKVFAALPDFRSPSGLARLEDGRVVVSDDRAGALFVLSKTGSLQFAFRR